MERAKLSFEMRFKNTLQHADLQDSIFLRGLLMRPFRFGDLRLRLRDQHGKMRLREKQDTPVEFRMGEKGVRLAQTMQVGPHIHVDVVIQL